MSKLKLFITLTIIITSTLGAFGVKAAIVGNTNQATLTASPQTGSYNINDNFSVGIYVNTHGQSVVVVAAYLNYDKTHFQAVSIDTTGSVFTMEAEKIIDSTNGVIKITRGIPSPGVNTANGLVATINFKAIGGTTPVSDNLTFQFTSGSTIESNVILNDGLGTDYLSGVYNAKYTVSGGTDTTPPSISSVTALSITSSGATISWVTNEASNSQVDYGLTTSYGNQTTLNTSMVTSHSQSLSGLTANTTYHYRVKSRDAAGNLANSADYTFTTGAASCTTRSLVNGSVSPGSITTGGSYTVSCDYGVSTNAINPVVGSGSCTFQNFVGTAARFTCTAGSNVGTFSNSCTLSNMPPDYYCSRTDTITSLTVTSASPVTDTAVPSTPTNFVATAVSSYQINLSWSASTDNIGVSGYKIYRCSGVGCVPTIHIKSVTTNSYSDTNLSGSTIYNYRIAAYDAAGNVSVQSNAFGATTLKSTATPTPTPIPTSTVPSAPTPIRAPQTGIVFTKDLYFGIKDSQVTSLQGFLAKDKTIYPGGIITGYFGLLTQAAVQRFQCKYNIICSGSPFVNGYGVVGPKTRLKLNELYGGAAQTEEELIAQLEAQIKILQDQIAQLLIQINQLLQQKTQQ